MEVKLQKTKDAILEAAVQLFWKKGYHQTSLEDILDESGVTKGNFYYYFKSKEELAMAVIDAFAQQTTAALERAVKLEPDPLKRVVQRLEFMASRAEELCRQGGCLIGNFGQELSMTNEAFREKLADVFNFWCEAWQQDLEAARVKYAPHLQVDTKSMAEMLLAGCEGAMLLGKTKRDAQAAARSIRQLTELVQRAFLS